MTAATTTLARNQIVVLSVLEDGAERTGKEVLSRARPFGVRDSTTYAALSSLEESGLLTARWDGDGPTKRVRRIYCITPSGSHALEQERKVLRKL